MGTLDLEKKLEEMIWRLDASVDEDEKARLSLQIKMMELLFKVRGNAPQVKGASDGEHPSVARARKARP